MCIRERAKWRAGRAVRSAEYFMQYTRIKLTITNRRGIYPHLPVKAYSKPKRYISADDVLPSLSFSLSLSSSLFLSVVCVCVCMYMGVCVYYCVKL